MVINGMEKRKCKGEWEVWDVQEVVRVGRPHGDSEVRQSLEGVRGGAKQVSEEGPSHREWTSQSTDAHLVWSQDSFTLLQFVEDAKELLFVFDFLDERVLETYRDPWVIL